MSAAAKKTVVSAALRKFMGSDAPTMKDSLKQVWVYVKKNNLQSQENKREFVCDDKLKPIFKTNTVHMYNVLKGLSAHFSKE